MSGKTLDDVVNGLGILNKNIEDLIDLQRFSSNNFSRNSTSVSRRYFGENSFERTRELRADLEDLEGNSSKFSLLLRGFKESGRNLRRQEERLRSLTVKYNKAQEDLKKSLGKKGITDAEAIKEAEDEIKTLNEDTERLKENFDTLFDPLVDGLDEGKIEEIKKVLEENYVDIFNDKITGTDLDDFVKNLNAIGGAGFNNFNIINVKELSKALKESNESEEKLERTASKLNAVYDNRINQLNEQARLNEMAFRTMKNGFNEIGRGFGKLKSLSEDLTNGWRKVDQASANFAKNIGVGSKGLIALRKNTIDMVKNGGIGLNYDIGMEELVELQQNYAQAVGRNVGLTVNDVETSAAMSRLMGGKGGEFATALENFGLSYSEAGNRVGKMFKTASKYGLSFEKYSQNFLTNIKLAQNYTFKDGLRGLERMAQKSTAIKLDMQQIASFADKVSTLQGAVESSASLQVLGGPFAQFSDPLGMLNEGLTNVEGLMDRFQNMTQNLGKFNTETGQVEVSAFNRQRVKAAAQAMGMDYNQVMESVQTQGRRKFIEDNIKNDFTDEEKEFLMNTATVQNGTPQMTYINSEGKRVTKDVNSMDSEDIKQARAQSQSDSDNIKDIAKTTRSFDEKVEGVKKTIEAIKAGWVEGSMNWINNKLNDITKYLGVIKFAVASIAIGKGISAIGNFAQGAYDLGIGGKYLTKLGKLGNGNLLQGTYKLAGGAKTMSALGTVATYVPTVAAVVGGGMLYYNGRKIEKNRDDLVGSGKIKKDSEEDRKLTKQKTNKQALGAGLGLGGIAGGITGGIAAGATAGSVVPVVGTIIGAAIGAGVGLLGAEVVKKKEIEKRHKEAIIEEGLRESIKRNHGFALGGGYTKEEYEKINSAIKNGGDNTITKAEFEDLPEALRKKMQESGDVSLFSELEEFVIDEATMDAQTVYLNAKEFKVSKDSNVTTKANGGLLNGPSHANGGMPIVGSNIEVEGGEFVVNKHAAKQNLGLLNTINKTGRGDVTNSNKVTENNSTVSNVNKTSDSSFISTVLKNGDIVTYVSHINNGDIISKISSFLGKSNDKPVSYINKVSNSNGSIISNTNNDNVVSHINKMSNGGIINNTNNTNNDTVLRNGSKYNTISYINKMSNGGMVTSSNTVLEGNNKHNFVFHINKNGNKSILTKVNDVLTNNNGNIISNNNDIVKTNGFLNGNKSFLKVPVLQNIIKESAIGNIKSREDSGIKPIKVSPLVDVISNKGGMSIEPININISGTIKLDGGNGREIDMNALLKDPIFIKNITNLIEQQMIYNTNGARYANKLIK